MATPGAGYVYVGAARWTGGTQGGLFRRAAGDERWEAMTKGLPDPAHVQAITVHPDQPSLVYLATQDGPYRSLDHGASWHRLDFARGVQVWSIAIHPHRSRTVYVGTSPVGVYRSEDGGDTWQRLPKATQRPRVTMNFDCRVMRVAIDPAQPEHLYAALEVGGMMCSVDGGETWRDGSDDLVRLAQAPHRKSRIASDTEDEGMLDAHAVCVSAARPGTAILAVRMGLFRSADHGTTWDDMEVGRFSPLTYARDIRVSPHDPRVLYACLSPASRSQDGALYRSQDVGETWQRFDRGVKAEATMMAVAPHPRHPEQVYGVARHGQVFGTLDGGRTWRESRLPDGVQDVYAVACG